ncbi:MAG: S-methyl-5-thioribose-1-phosphate isomerase [Wenzhouxiangellaceae bacterium]
MNQSPTQTSTAPAPLIWRDDHLAVLDQRLLPSEVSYLQAVNAAQTAQAIRDLAVRGAPAIGIAAAYGLTLEARLLAAAGHDLTRSTLEPALTVLAQARPTAVNLGWALQRMARLLDQPGLEWPDLLAEAGRIHQEERDSNAAMARIGADFIRPGSRVLTICNTGALATGGSGTAYAVIVEAWRRGHLVEAFAAETRPWFQGTRLTTWELAQAGVRHRLLVDSAVPWLLKTQAIDWVISGADRVVANGDTANKIGTYAAALAARAHGAKMMVVAPFSTLDEATPNGDAIPIEERPADEVTAPGGRALAPAGTAVWNPVFDVTPAELVDVLVTERGAIEHPDRERLSAWWPTT